MEEDDAVAIELEALEVTYGESLEVLARKPLQVSLHVTPFTGEDESQQYVCADLCMAVTADYPEALPDIQLRNCKGAQTCCSAFSDAVSMLESHRLPVHAGLSDARQAQLRSRLQEEAVGLAGSMMLGHLAETARDALTAMNSPEGDCVFCRCPLREDRSAPGISGQDEEELLRLPCYHVYHL